MLPVCLLLAMAKLIQLPYLEQFAFGRIDAKKMGVFICTPEEHACLGRQKTSGRKEPRRHV